MSGESQINLEEGMGEDLESRSSLPQSAPSPLESVRLAAAPLILAAPVLYFGVLRAVETGRALREADWHFGATLPLSISFSDMGGFTPAAHSEIPTGEALLIVLFCLGMGCFLLSSALRFLTAGQIRR